MKNDLINMDNMGAAAHRGHCVTPEPEFLVENLHRPRRVPMGVSAEKRHPRRIRQSFHPGSVP